MIRLLIGAIIPLLFLAAIEYVIISSIMMTCDEICIDLLLYITIAVIGYLGVLAGTFSFRRRPIDRSPILNFFIGFGIAAFVQKVFFLLLVFVQTVISTIIEWFEIGPQFSATTLLFYISLTPLIAMIYGIIFGKYKFETEHVNLTYPDLPDEFDGFRIVHFSDAHSGTWDSKLGVSKGIELINKQGPDLILFTGDLVNSSKDEIDPFIDLFSSLQANYGKFAVLGNHDYYGQPMDRYLRPSYYEEFFHKYDQMGFNLLNNQSQKISKNGRHIRLVGVENWGHGRFFPKRGDLQKATEQCEENEFTILLSHDPSHWDAKALDFPKHFHLTLSGHTHAFQMGLNLPFIKWSPVKYRYRRWMGLYEEKGQFLYVNRGFGMLLYPGRVGMSPEVTVITLKKDSVENVSFADHNK